MLPPPPFHLRYDVELFQRIEQLIGKQLPLHPTVEEEVLALMERVAEAQRIARVVSGTPLEAQRIARVVSGTPLEAQRIARVVSSTPLEDSQSGQ